MISVKYYEYNGKQYTAKEICQRVGIHIQTFYLRLRSGWSLERIMNTKPVPPTERNRKEKGED